MTASHVAYLGNSLIESVLKPFESDKKNTFTQFSNVFVNSQILMMASPTQN